MKHTILYDVIGIIHFLGITAVATYSSLFRKSKYDVYVLLSIFAIIILWTFHSGECFVSQYVKQKTHKNEHDMLFIFNGNRNALTIFSTLIIIMYLVSIWQLLLRNNYSIYSCIGLSVVYIAYLAAYKLPKNRNSNYHFTIMNPITCITFIAFGLYVMSRL